MYIKKNEHTTQRKRMRAIATIEFMTFIAYSKAHALSRAKRAGMRR
jgi:hypothetical protein